MGGGDGEGGMGKRVGVRTLAGMSSARSGMCRSPITRIRKAIVDYAKGVVVAGRAEGGRGVDSEDGSFRGVILRVIAEQMGIRGGASSALGGVACC
jgi:hypothetical protein